MLTDCGLLSPEEVKKYKEFFNKRCEALLSGQFTGGCISSVPCSNCNHLISDSLCLCSMTFNLPKLRDV